MSDNTSETSVSTPGGERLESRIRALLPNLNPSSVRIARILLDDLAGASRRTMAELAAMAGTSESSVVRTTRALGFHGYAELRLALAAEVARGNTGPQVSGDITPADSLADVVAKLAGEEMQAISDTAAQLDVDAMDRIVDLMIKARRINIHGSGASGLVAMDLHHKLERIGYPSHVYCDVHNGLTSAALLGTEDVAVGISFSGETSDVIGSMRLAATAGAATVAITNHPRSQLATLSDHVLLPAGAETAFRPGALASRISQLLTIDCLFVGIAQRTYDRTMRALSLTHEALQSQRTPPRKNRP